MDACCTCATLLHAVSRPSQPEKPIPQDRRLDCCGRVICGMCIQKNPRFEQYCPYCQISTAPSPLLPPGGLRAPPSYDIVAADKSAPPPPPYTLHAAPEPRPPRQLRRPPTADDNNNHDDEKAAMAADDDDADAAPDALHFLDHDRDSIASLSLRYGVPAAALRRHNRLAADHLLAARQTVLIPDARRYHGNSSSGGGGLSSSSHAGPAPGVSLSPQPVEGEAEAARKARIRRWMVACKCADYDAAVFYLDQAGHDLGAAVETYLGDEAWERANPLRSGEGRGKGVSRAFGGGGGTPARR